MTLNDDGARVREVAGAPSGLAVRFGAMSPTWIWMQVAIVLLVLVGIVIAIARLA